MKMTKKLRQVVSVLTVGTALALTGSAARAQSSGAEGVCPNQNCGNECYGFQCALQGGYWINGAPFNTQYPVCANCDGKCPAHLLYVEISPSECRFRGFEDSQGNWHDPQSSHYCNSYRPFGTVYGDCKTP